MDYYFLLAFVAGVLTIAAPCILIPLPIVFGTSIGQVSKLRPLFITLGFILSFASLSLLANYIVKNLGLDPNVLRNIAVVVLALFAVIMIWPDLFERLIGRLSGLIGKVNQVGQAASSGNLGGFIIGLVIGIVWAPCAGPILGSILTLIALEQDFAQASTLLISYSVGAGLPMLLIAYGGQVVTTKVRLIARYAATLQKLFGIILFLLALSIYFSYDTLIQTKLLEKLPNFSTGVEEQLTKQVLPDKKDGRAHLDKYGLAPEFTGIEKWLNLPEGKESLTLAELKGKVILIDFWTYSCINCIRTLPYVTKWYDKYKDQGLVVVGVHTPEFAFEKKTENVETAIKRHKINFPVAQDNEFGTWRAYSNQYWPAKYLIDQEGNVVYYHFGEGEYHTTENAIRQLLGLDENSYSQVAEQSFLPRSPEMYFGTDRIDNLVPAQIPSTTGQFYQPSGGPDVNQFELQGYWKFYKEKAVVEPNPKGESGGQIILHFKGKKAFMVASSPEPQDITVYNPDKTLKKISVSFAKLYEIFTSNESRIQTIVIDIPKVGFEAYTFTFE